uniref:Uncharacterized protein n=1 Tax=Glossina morsitans morsitans TaxID=37546 RepID=A0A1B0FR45_GLOMM
MTTRNIGKRLQTTILNLLPCSTYESTHIDEDISVDDKSGKLVCPTKVSCSYGILPSQLSFADSYRTILAQSISSHSSHSSLKPFPLLHKVHARL